MRVFNQGAANSYSAATSITERDFSWGQAVLVTLCLVICGCHSRETKPDPSIEILRIPPADAGGPDKLDIIEGKVNGVQPEQRIVLYAKNRTWWVQPLLAEPFTRVRANATWTNSTHLGTEYAALLVGPGFHPPARLDELPARGGEVAAVSVVKGSDPKAGVTNTLQFSGYEWRIRSAPSDRGGRNLYDANNAWTDKRGFLHLRIAKASGQWTCAEITLTRSLGYGSYSFVAQDTSNLDPAAVFTIFTWDYAGSDPNNREMDIEISRFGDPAAKNAQFVVQPFYLPTNAVRFATPSGVLTHTLKWEPGRASFRTVRNGALGAKGPVAEHVFTSGVPFPGAESVRMNLYVFHTARKPFEHESEVVVEKFEYLP